MKKKILIVAAHPDDELLGCGGTVARMVADGAQAYSLILGEGITSRDQSRNASSKKKELSSLKDNAREANKILGITEVFFADFADNRFDSVDLLEIIKSIEDLKQKLKPEIIFTHFGNDLNIDHQRTYQAVLTATRPMTGEFVKEIYAFETVSSTEWNFPLTFSPNVFFDINSTLACKLKAFSQYVTELRDYPHPRSLRGLEELACYWGVKSGVPFAEAFQLVRMIQ
jgi:LmbE family N-acetylglucosaminyl deacetylase